MDPGFAPAFAALSDAYQSQERTPEILRQARSAAKRALELDPKLAEGYAALAGVEESDWNWSAAEGLYRKSIALNPTLAAACGCYGLELLILGRNEEAIRELRRAQMLDPMEASHSAVLAMAFSRLGRTSESEMEARKALAMDSTNWLAQLALAWNVAAAGQPEKALVLLTGGSSQSDSLDFRKLSPMQSGEIGYLYGRAGRRADALRVIRQLRERARTAPVPLYSIAAVYAGMGDETNALAALERGVAERSPYMPRSTLFPFNDLLRSNPAYQTLLVRMGIRSSNGSPIGARP